MALPALPIIAGLVKLANSLVAWLKKTPEEKAAARLKKRYKNRRKRSHEIGKAIKKSKKKGDTSGLEKIINSRK